MGSRFFGVVVLMFAASCASGHDDADDALAARGDALTVPSGIPVIRHWEKPRDASVVALTFDDGPDDTGGNTDRILDTLRAHGVKATFFINSRTGGNIKYSSTAKRILGRIVAEGHELGNHSAHHWNLADPDTPVDLELKRVEWDLGYAAPTAPTLSLVRAPYGSPYLSGTQADLDRVAPIVARHGVHVGWSIDALDWQCVGKSPSCIVNRVLYRVDLGRRGPILLHDTLRVTADALPTLIVEVKKRGLRFVTAEALVRMKYGKSSYDLMRAYRGY